MCGQEIPDVEAISTIVSSSPIVQSPIRTSSPDQVTEMTFSIGNSTLSCRE